MMDRKLLLLVEIVMTSWIGICFEVVNLTRLADIVLGKRGIKSNSQTFGLKKYGAPAAIESDEKV